MDKNLISKITLQNNRIIVEYGGCVYYFDFQDSISAKWLYNYLRLDPRITHLKLENWKKETSMMEDKKPRKFYIRDVNNNPIGVVIFSAPKRQGHVRDVAVSWCHNDDKFDKKVGTQKALERFNTGKTIPVKIVGKNPVHVLREMFQIGL